MGSALISIALRVRKAAPGFQSFYLEIEIERFELFGHPGVRRFATRSGSGGWVAK